MSCEYDLRYNYYRMNINHVICILVAVECTLYMYYVVLYRYFPCPYLCCVLCVTYLRAGLVVILSGYNLLLHIRYDV